MDKIINDLKAMLTDIRAYIVAAIIAWLSMASVEVNNAVDGLQEQASEAVAEIQE